jgi:hypothetical protein
MHSDWRGVICTLAVVSVALIIPWPAPVSADSQHDGPWFKAKVGTSIRYRITQPETVPGVAPKSAVITEEVVSATPETVTVKSTRTAAGEAERTNTATRPRRISGQQYDQFLRNIGYDRKGVDIKVSGQTFSCRQYERDYDSSDGNPDHSVRVWTVFCRELPGWVAAQRAGSASWKNDEVRFELLEVKP